MVILGRYYDRRLVVSSLLLVTLAVSFWSGSRVPQLSEKASMGAETEMDAIGFETVLLVQPDDPAIKKILYTTVNWADTNKKGMTFGVLFAAALMTMFALMRRRAFKGAFANSALGMVIGAPLGVCVNCAAPIATGMAAAGTRVETTLAAMISSPTMNVIVLTMLFSLFPFYIIALKIGLTVGLLLIVIPVLCRYVLKRDVEKSIRNGTLNAMSDDACELPAPGADADAGVPWSESLSWVVKTYATNLWFVAKTTVPLMLLAGFLGAVLITLLPWGSLADIVPGDGKVATLAGLFVVAIIGTLLPVPIAFDVIVTSVLIAAGMPIKFAMVLLLTLGTFSIYSYFIVSRAISVRAAASLFVAVVLLGVSAGVLGHYASKYDDQRKTRFFVEFFFANEEVPEPGLVFSVDEGPVPALPGIPAVNSDVLEAAEGVQVSRADFFERAVAEASPFTKLPATDFGIDVPYRFSLFRMEIPLVQGYGRGVSSGDVNNDGWVDLLFHTDTGLLLFANNSGRSFHRMPVDIGDLARKPLINAALVDLDNDGWLDIYFSVFEDHAYILHSQNGTFDQSQLTQLARAGEEDLSPSAGFGDIDRDGQLEIVQGNWAIAWGEGNWLSSDVTRNVIYDFDGLSYGMRPLELPSSIPTTVLVSDINNDEVADIIVGNDFAPPDYYLFGDGTGAFTQIVHEQGIIPNTPSDTMSIDSADINNDLTMELFLADLARYDDNHEKFGTIAFEESCNELTTQDERDYCMSYSQVHELFADIKQTRNVSQCLTIDDSRLQVECVTAFVVSQPEHRGGYASRDSCGRIPERWTMARRMCFSTLRPSGEPDEEVMARQIPERKFNNTLLMMQPDGSFTNEAPEMGLEKAGWAWNARFADLDNDEYQDLFVVNGTWRSNQRLESNYFFRNNAGNSFENLTDEYGLASYLATSSYTYIDMDHDGDLDIVVIPVNGPVSVYRNNNDSGNRIAFSLRDSIGNRFGIGGKIILSYGDDSRNQQIREIKASGGFISYDAPIAYFGLGSFDTVNQVEVIWSTGERTVIDRPFAQGAHYTIDREQTRVAVNSE